jgi:hypothetical protein
MNTQEFDKILNERLFKIKEVLANKAKEYSSDKDRLHNFKEASKFLNCTPEKALLGFLTKHLVSVIDMINNSNVIYDEAIINEKIGDCINYFILLEALMKEHILDLEMI